jgi:hypothetical protein
MKQSPQRRRELALHSKLKRELIDQYGECCQTCGSTGDWRGISLSHIIALGRGGKTERGNLILECGPDHERYEKKPELREQEHPELFEKYPELRS